MKRTTFTTLLYLHEYVLGLFSYQVNVWKEKQPIVINLILFSREELKCIDKKQKLIMYPQYFR